MSFRSSSMRAIKKFCIGTFQKLQSVKSEKQGLLQYSRNNLIEDSLIS